MKHFFILPFLFLIFSASAFCQPNIKAEIDSLMKILPTTGQDTVREELYSELAFRWAQLNPDSTIFYLKEKLALSQKLKDEKRIIGNMINLGYHYNLFGESAKAIEIYQDAMHLTNKHDLDNFSVTLAFTGLAYRTQGDYNNALVYLFKAYNIWGDLYKKGELKNNKGAIGGPMSIGEIYEETDRLDSALIFTNLAYNRLLSIKDMRNAIPFSYEIPTVLGNIYSKQNKPDLALHFYQEGLEQAVTQSNSYGIEITRLALAKLYSKTKHPELSVTNAEQALSSATKTKNYSVVREQDFYCAKFMKNKATLQKLYIITILPMLQKIASLILKKQNKSEI